MAGEFLPFTNSDIRNDFCYYQILGGGVRKYLKPQQPVCSAELNIITTIVKCLLREHSPILFNDAVFTL